jgi:hypothetical protein
MTTSTKTARPRRSLARTMAVIAIIAVDLAALRSTLPMIPNPGLVVMVLVLEMGLFRAAYRRVEARAFWVGFEASGWLYVLASSAYARALWRSSRSLFERMILGRPIGTPSEMNQFLLFALFAGVLQLAFGLAIALTFGLFCRKTWAVSGQRPPG